MTRIGLTRRHFLALLSAFALPLLPGLGRWLGGRLGGGPTPAGGELSGRFVGLFSHPVSAAAIGHEYLVTRSAEATSSLLAGTVAAALVGAGADAPATCQSMSDDDLAAALAERIAQDFATEDVVVVRGWILSRTEARLCGLAALAA
jgi:hypothetical protein